MEQRHVWDLAAVAMLAASNAALYCWVVVNELKLNYHDSGTIIFTAYPDYGNLNSLTAAQYTVCG